VRALRRDSGLDGQLARGLPGPRRELARRRGRRAGEHVGEVGVGLDARGLAALDERVRSTLRRSSGRAAPRPPPRPRSRSGPGRSWPTCHGTRARSAPSTRCDRCAHGRTCRRRAPGRGRARADARAAAAGVPFPPEGPVAPCTTSWVLRIGDSKRVSASVSIADRTDPLSRGLRGPFSGGRKVPFQFAVPTYVRVSPSMPFVASATARAGVEDRRVAHVRRRPGGVPVQRSPRDRWTRHLLDLVSALRTFLR